MNNEKQLDSEYFDVWSPVDPEEDAIDPGYEHPPEWPEHKPGSDKDGIGKKEEISRKETADTPDIPTSLNEELEEKIRENPNKFLGCGG